MSRDTDIRSGTPPVGVRCSWCGTPLCGRGWKLSEGGGPSRWICPGTRADGFATPNAFADYFAHATGDVFHGLRIAW